MTEEKMSGRKEGAIVNVWKIARVVSDSGTIRNLNANQTKEKQTYELIEKTTTKRNNTWIGEREIISGKEGDAKNSGQQALDEKNGTNAGAVSWKRTLLSLSRRWYLLVKVIIYRWMKLWLSLQLFALFLAHCVWRFWWKGMKVMREGEISERMPKTTTKQ